ncbi:MAG: flavin reductase family protein [Clostridiales Family XIII bacterium]|nr:flavin reductase family protein [Clostridiales Family XIII bacterium]
MKKDIGPSELVFPTPVFIAGTYDANDVPNAVTLAWGGVACSSPAAVSIAVRPSRYSYENLMLRKAFTINLPPAKYAKEADYFGIASGKNGNKFAATGLTPVRSEFVDAPYIEEFPYNMECEVTHTLDLGSHTLFIGAVKNVKVGEELLGENGNLLWERAGFLTYDGADRTYRLPGEITEKAFRAGLIFRTESENNAG